MSGEMPAFKPEDQPGFITRKESPVPFDPKDSKGARKIPSVENPAAISEELKAAAEHKKMSMAPSFDRLIEVTIELTEAVRTLIATEKILVKFMILFQLTQLALVFIMFYVVLHK